MKETYELWKERFSSELLEDHNKNGKYHKEGNILTHSLMVFNEAFFNGTDFMSIVALLHDIGKPLSVEWKDDRKMFPNHEGMSTFLSVNFLRELVKMGKIQEDEIFEILFTINAHGNLMKYRDSKKHWGLYKYEIEKLEWIKEFNKFDFAGRITDVPFKLPEINVESKQFLNKNNPEQPFVVFGIGVPSSGKTTFLQENLKKDIEIISRDAILEEFGKEYNLGKTYSEIWKNLTDDNQKEIDNRFNNKLKKLQEQNKNICIDMTLISYKSRKRMLNKIKNNYQIIYGNFITDYEDIMQRNEKRFKETGKLIPKGVLHNFMKNYQFPLYGEDDRILKIDNILL